MNEARAAPRRAVMRWALRLFRREWRQQLLVITMLTVAVAAAVFGAAAAYGATPSRDAEFGRANLRLSLKSADPSVLAEYVSAVRKQYGKVELVGHRTIAIPGSTRSVEIRSQDPGGTFGAPMLALVKGHFPAGAGEIALTDRIASLFDVGVGERFTFDGTELHVAGIVENPGNLDDEFALTSSDSIATSGEVTILTHVDDESVAPPTAPGGIEGLSVEPRGASEKTTAAVLVLVVATTAMLLVSLMAAAGFVAVAQRRMRQLGMFAAVGATRRQLRSVMVVNGAAVGVVAAVVGMLAALTAWVVFAPTLEGAAAHRLGRLDVPWWILLVGGVLAIGSSTAAAWWPARSVARVPIVQALSGRPPRPQRARRSALAGVAMLVIGVVCISAGLDPAQDDANVLLFISGLVAIGGAVLFMAVPALRALARLASRLPVAPRLAIRDLARYQARSGAALAAISLGLAIAISIVAIAAAAENGADEGNLGANQLIVWVGTNRPTDKLFMPDLEPKALANARATVDNLARTLAGAKVIPLDVVVDPNIAETREGMVLRPTVILGRPISEHTVRDSGAVFVATPEVLRYLDVDPSTIASDTVLLSHVPGEVFLTGEISNSVYQRNPVPDAIVQRIRAGRYSSAPRSLITEHGLRAVGWWRSMTAGWLVESQSPIGDAQLAAIRSRVADAGLAIEPRDEQSSLTAVRTGATTAGMLLALAILAMTVSLLRGESSRDLRTLTAAGATRRTRRALTASTAASLALLAVLLGGAGAYAALIAGYWPELGGLGNVPVRHLAVLAIGLPTLAAVTCWLLAGREPRDFGRSAID